MAASVPLPASQEPFSNDARNAFEQYINSAEHKNRSRLDGFKQLQIQVSKQSMSCISEYV
jgi:hypothetical protein